MIMLCFKCKEEIPDDTTVCPHCRTKLTTGELGKIEAPPRPPQFSEFVTGELLAKEIVGEICDPKEDTILTKTR